MEKTTTTTTTNSETKKRSCYERLICLQAFRTAAGVKLHTTRFHDKNRQRFSCQLCNNSYFAKESLIKHLNRDHVKSDIEKEL